MDTSPARSHVPVCRAYSRINSTKSPASSASQCRRHNLGECAKAFGVDQCVSAGVVEMSVFVPLRNRRQSRDWGRGTVRLVRLGLKFVMRNYGEILSYFLAASQTQLLDIPSFKAGRFITRNFASRFSCLAKTQMLTLTVQRRRSLKSNSCSGRRIFNLHTPQRNHDPRCYQASNMSRIKGRYSTPRVNLDI